LLFVLSAAGCFPDVRALPPSGGPSGAAGDSDAGSTAGRHDAGGTAGAGGSSFGGGGGDIAGGGTGGTECGLETFDTKPIASNALLLLDRSAAMAYHLDGSACSTSSPCDASNPTKWDSVAGAVRQVVAESEMLVNWGLKYFPDDDQCLVASMPAVAVGPGQATAIASSIASSPVAGMAPIADAEHSSGAYLIGLAMRSITPAYIVLITGGAETCSATDSAAVVAYVLSLGIPTFVVAVGDVGVAQASLNAMAAAGGEARPGDGMGRTYDVADSAPALLAALAAIAGRIDTCTLALAAVPPVPTNIAVIASGTRIPMDPTNGWSYGPGFQSIVINGSYCDMLVSGTIQQVQTVFGCSNAPVRVP
jgi:hypothetical protein